MGATKPIFMLNLFILEIFLLNLLLCSSIVAGNREHKVHNISLYPDKESWCKTVPIEQIISHPGCRQVKIHNNVCVGGCFSYSIPRTEPSDPGEVIVPYCDSCQPSETHWRHVTLDCQEEEHRNSINSDENYQPLLVKRVEIITNCSCNSCERKQDSHERGHHTSNSIESEENDEFGSSNEFASTNHDLNSKNDISDLLEVIYLANDNDTDPSANHYDHLNNHNHQLFNKKIAAVLKNIQEKNLKYDKMQLIELLKMIQSPDNDNGKHNDKTLDHLIESLKHENPQLDTKQLRDVFRSLDENNHHSHRYQPHQPHHHANGEIVDQTHHLQKGLHGALIIKSNDENDGNTDDEDGDIILDTEIKEKLKVKSDELNPNHAGTVLTYGHHNDNPHHHTHHTHHTHHHHHPHHHQHLNDEQ
uniref:Putative neuroblastoma suppressor of tumorigenicity 1 n=1 Tax=Corethrella appendiculata TaxID=1370023 RepID=U5EUC2_9DIPT